MWWLFPIASQNDSFKIHSAQCHLSNLHKLSEKFYTRYGEAPYVNRETVYTSAPSLYPLTKCHMQCTTVYTEYLFWFICLFALKLIIKVPLEFEKRLIALKFAIITQMINFIIYLKIHWKFQRTNKQTVYSDKFQDSIVLTVIGAHRKRKL